MKLASLIVFWGFAALTALVIVVWLADRLVPRTGTRFSITWIGHPMVSDNDPYTPSQGWMPQVKIGLRSDGVVVWTNASKTTP